MDTFLKRLAKLQIQYNDTFITPHETFVVYSYTRFRNEPATLLALYPNRFVCVTLRVSYSYLSVSSGYL